MSLSVPNASPPRPLKPVAGAFRHDGAPFVPLSPHKSVRNAAIIYQAIKDMPDKTLIRGDFDKHSRPLIYFPDRPQKKIGHLNPVAAKNASFDRAEFASFMRSIVEATFKTAPAHSPQMKAAFDLRSKTLAVSKQERDFSVGDIRESLRSIAKAWNRQNLKYLTSPHRSQPGNDSPLQAKRLRQFCDIKGALVAQLCDALSIGLKGDDGRNKALAAVQAMRQMLFSYRIVRDKEGLSFADFLQTHAISTAVHRFAKLWLALSGPERYGRTQFCTESWALEMDKVCPQIIKQYRAQKRLASEGENKQESKPVENFAVASTNATADRLAMACTPRVLTRRFKHPVSPAFGSSADRTAIPSSELIRQSSVPQLRSGQLRSTRGRSSGSVRTDSVIFQRIDFSSVADAPATGSTKDTTPRQTH